MNSSKTQSMLLNRRKREIEVAEARLVHQGTDVVNRSRVGYLGVVVDRELKLKDSNPYSALCGPDGSYTSGWSS